MTKITAAVRTPTMRPQTAIPHAIMRAIATETAERHGVKLEQLKSDNKARPVSDARQEAMFEMRIANLWSLPQIGAFFGRDHTTVIHGINAHRKRLAAIDAGNAEGRALRIGVTIEAAMKDSPGWVRLSFAQQDRLLETAALVGRMLA